MNEYILIILAGIISILILSLAPLLRNTVFSVINYRGNKVTRIGFLLIFSWAICLLVYFLFFENTGPSSIHLRIIVTTFFVSLVGIVDDILEVREKGFKGHLKALLNFKITPGVFKLVVIGSLSLYIAFSVKNVFYIAVLSALIISFFANFINLLDLRPGRSLKVFIFLSFILGGYSFLFSNYQKIMTMKLLWIPLIPSVLIFLILDLRERAILGDSGANSLGFFLGISIIYLINNVILLSVVFIILALINLYAEYGSITKLVSNSKLLKYLDEMGRSKVVDN